MQRNALFLSQYEEICACRQFQKETILILINWHHRL